MWTLAIFKDTQTLQKFNRASRMIFGQSGVPEFRHIPGLYRMRVFTSFLACAFSEQLLKFCGQLHFSTDWSDPKPAPRLILFMTEINKPVHIMCWPFLCGVETRSVCSWMRFFFTIRVIRFHYGTFGLVILYSYKHWCNLLPLIKALNNSAQRGWMDIWEGVLYPDLILCLVFCLLKIFMASLLTEVYKLNSVKPKTEWDWNS